MIKHFILSGFTVQMMLDVALYFKQHAVQIDAERVWNTINSLHYGKLFNCILWAMVQHCGFKQEDFNGICNEAPDQIEEILSDLEEGGWMGWQDKSAREEGWHEYNRQVLMESQNKLQYFLYLKRTNRKGWMLWLPMGVMLAVTLTALGMSIVGKFGGIFAGTTANLGGDLLQGCFAVALFALGVMVAVQGIRKLWGKNN